MRYILTLLTCPDISQCCLYRACLSSYCLQTDPILCIYSFIHSIAMCRMRRFLAVLRSFFHSSLLYTLSFQPFTPTSLHPPSLHLAIYFLVYLSASLFPNSYIILLWEFYFLPFSVHAQTNVIYLTLLSLLYIVGFLTIASVQLQARGAQRVPGS